MSASVTLSRTVLALGILALPQTVVAGEIFPYEHPQTGAKTYTLKQGSTVARISPSNGANVFSIKVAGVEYLATPPDMHDFFGLFYGTPVLYPTPNRVRDATFTFAGKEYTLAPNLPPHRIHGLVLDADWEVVSTETTGSSAAIRLALDIDEGSRIFEQFPFRHRIVLTVEVKPNAVRWTYEVDNTTGSAPVPFGFGLHPMFIYQGARADTWVTIPASHLMETQDLFPTGRLIPASELDYPLGDAVSLQGRNFDDVFWGLSPTESVTVEFRDKDLEITMSASDSFSHVVLYSPEWPVFSVEHQTSSTDAHNLHAGGKVEEASLQVCPAGDTCSGWVEYGFRVASDIDWVFSDEGFVLSLQHCQSCHGPAFTGGRTRSLWSGEWQHARAAADIANVIANGIPGTEMPAFAGLLDDSQIESLATVMVELLQKFPSAMVEAGLQAAHDRPRQSYRETFRLETVVDKLSVPWSLAFLPDGKIIVTERDGYLRLVQDGEKSDPVAGTPGVWARQDGGLLALALDSDYPGNGWVYLSYADPGDTPGTSMTKIVRGRIAAHTWIDEEVLWQAPASLYTDNNSHYGSRLLLDGDYLYFSIGDRGERDKAQDLASPFGKIHRIHRDGGVPADNPFVDQEGAFPSIWSYGHRNPQGLELSADGVLWSAEHGPTGGDELNRIVRAGNYGWPLATRGTEMDGSPIATGTRVPGMIDPDHVWQETIAPSNIAFYTGRQFPGWQGSLFVASMAAQELRRLEIEDGVVTAQELLLNTTGRIRDVKQGPDGYLYLAVERYGGHGGILRLVPASISSPSLDTGDFRMD